MALLIQQQMIEIISRVKKDNRPG